MVRPQNPTYITLSDLLSSGQGHVVCTVLVLEQNGALEDAIESHACSLEASMFVPNSMPLGRPLPDRLTL
jgi:hypothetical protein